MKTIIKPGRVIPPKINRTGDGDREDGSVIKKKIKRDRLMMKLQAGEKDDEEWRVGTINTRMSRHTGDKMDNRIDWTKSRRGYRNMLKDVYGGTTDKNHLSETTEGRIAGTKMVKEKDMKNWRWRRCRTRPKYQIHQYDITQNEWRGRIIGVSENQLGERYQHIMNREGRARDTKYEQVATRLENCSETNGDGSRRNHNRKLFKKQTSAQKRKMQGRRRWKNCKLERRQSNDSEDIPRPQMETRTCTRRAEAHLLTEEDSADRKGKALAREEEPIEIF